MSIKFAQPLKTKTMKERNWKQLASELKECIFCSEFTKINIVIDTDIAGAADGIIIRPINSHSVYCMDDVVDFCRVKKLSSYVSLDECGIFVRIH